MSVSLFRRSKPMTAPVPGDVYQRNIFHSVETARVVAVTEDGFPVPHVRYIARNDMIDGPSRGRHETARGDLRTLTVESFTRLFGLPVPN
ncbi:hypothetical protein [Niveispirillum irakense]|uniref:hypothetical protein n=1 Tax=Niveispirillum irakense TaxID=34011 RepID=UPI0012B67472|nr:hypothetical protein [Niveispirillum irakense]